MKNSVTLITFNIRTDQAQHDGINSFRNRLPGIVSFFQKIRPDIICFQEFTDTMFLELADKLSDYYIVGCGRGEDFGGEHCAIAYRKMAFELLSLDTFWLSETPEKEGSRFPFQSIWPRICTTAVLKKKAGGEPFRIYNTHLDHVSEFARQLGLKRIVERIGTDYEKQPRPLLLTGDFNAVPGSSPFSVLRDSGGPALQDLSADFPSTFHEFGKLPSGGIKIDYIFSDAGTAARVKNKMLYTQKENGVYLSDHYPLGITFTL